MIKPHGNILQNKGGLEYSNAYEERTIIQGTKTNGWSSIFMKSRFKPCYRIKIT